jgi:two-component system sensor histidine kinase QseC
LAKSQNWSLNAPERLQLAMPPGLVVVQDSGPGLSDADLARLGDRFFRVAANGADGSGLGWSIVRRLAQRYRLHVLVERSVELGGSRVVVTWPEV